MKAAKKKAIPKEKVEVLEPEPKASEESGSAMEVTMEVRFNCVKMVMETRVTNLMARPFNLAEQLVEYIMIGKKPAE